MKSDQQHVQFMLGMLLTVSKGAAEYILGKDGGKSRRPCTPAHLSTQLFEDAGLFVGLPPRQLRLPVVQGNRLLWFHVQRDAGVALVQGNAA